MRWKICAWGIGVNVAKLTTKEDIKKRFFHPRAYLRSEEVAPRGCAWCASGAIMIAQKGGAIVSKAVLAQSEKKETAPEASPKKATRFSITFDVRSIARLERMASDVEGKAEVIRQAIALEELYRDTRRAKGKFLIEYADGTMAEVVRP
jgi:hypothetical protein